MAADFRVARPAAAATPKNERFERARSRLIVEMGQGPIGVKVEPLADVKPAMCSVNTGPRPGDPISLLGRYWVD